MAHLQKVVRIFWEYLREACGENDYARYRTRVLAQQGRPMTLKAFYLWQQQHKYSRTTRCC